MADGRTPGARTRPGLDVPRDLRRGPKVRPSWDAETFGAFSERVARFLGTWRFIGYMSLFIAVWFVWNTLAPHHLRFDPYTFTFMTLLLSLQASYAAPLILLAQNRQTDRDRVQWEQDRARSDRLIADTEYLTRELATLRIALGEVATRDFIRSELRDLLDEMDGREGREGQAKKEKKDKRERRERGRHDKSTAVVEGVVDDGGDGGDTGETRTTVGVVDPDAKPDPDAEPGAVTQPDVVDRHRFDAVPAPPEL